MYASIENQVIPFELAHALGTRFAVKGYRQPASCFYYETHQVDGQPHHRVVSTQDYDLERLQPDEELGLRGGPKHSWSTVNDAPAYTLQEISQLLLLAYELPDFVQALAYTPGMPGLFAAYAEYYAPGFELQELQALGETETEARGNLLLALLAEPHYLALLPGVSNLVAA